MAWINSSSAASHYSIPGPPPDAAAIFKTKCAKCHGEDGKGLEKYKKVGQEDFTDSGFQKKHTDAQLSASINNGEGDFMPAWKGRLTPVEIKAMVAYVREFGKKK
ncbi:MAG TPA: c-type cytochrome [Blastocatellia bacterium]|nr:c-type cytochrome [Blastocatellia bacterium]